MQSIVNLTLTQVQAYVLAGSLADLSKLDFSCLNLTCYNLKNPAKLKALSSRYKPVGDIFYSLYNIIKKDVEKSVDNAEYIHVLLPYDFEKGVHDGAFYQCIEVLRILYPSDIEIFSVANFDFDASAATLEWSGSYYYHFYTSGEERYDNYLYFKKDIKHYQEINLFIKGYFSKIHHMKYLQTAVDAYNNSFNRIPLHMSYISLCIALETVVDGKSELMYRIRRTVSLICADNAHVAGIIFKNLKDIYELRSAIVHGEFYKIKLVKEYHPYLRSLISRIIVQLIHTDFRTATELQDNILFMSYNDRSKFFGDEPIALNIRTYAETLSSL